MEVGSGGPGRQWVKVGNGGSAKCYETNKMLFVYCVLMLI